MNLKLQLKRAFFISLCCAAGFGLIAFLISDHRIARFDQTVSDFIQGQRSPALTVVMKWFTTIGSGFPVVVITLFVMLFLYKVLHHRRELILFVWVVAGSALLNALLKTIFHRARPTLSRIAETNGFSFPSGHSMTAFSLYAIIAFLVWKHIKTAVGRGLFLLFSAAMIVAIGVSRIYLGVHYPSDVLGGYLASGCWMTASIWFYQRYAEKTDETTKPATS